MIDSVLDDLLAAALLILQRVVVLTVMLPVSLKVQKCKTLAKDKSMRNGLTYGFTTSDNSFFVKLVFVDLFVEDFLVHSVAEVAELVVAHATLRSHQLLDVFKVAELFVEIAFNASEDIEHHRDDDVE